MQGQHESTISLSILNFAFSIGHAKYRHFKIQVKGSGRGLIQDAGPNSKGPRKITEVVIAGRNTPDKELKL